MDDRVLLEAAATMFAGIVKNKDVEVELNNQYGSVEVFIKTKNTEVSTNINTVMTSIIKGLKNTNI